MNLHGERLVFNRAFVVSFCLTAMMVQADGTPKKSNTLYLVKRIYVGEWPSLGPDSYPGRQKELQDEAAAEKVRKTFLEAELSSAGFTVVEEKEHADAVLSGYWAISVVEDGEQPDPPEYTFIYHLTPPSNPSVADLANEIWKTEFTVRSRTFGSEFDRKVMSRVVSKLVKAWTGSAKKAGIKTTTKGSVRS